jgi:succinate dehydrogenase flavin-adding protein (antitoxin of CptAB toxin-antitoxin module)
MENDWLQHHQQLGVQDIKSRCEVYIKKNKISFMASIEARGFLRLDYCIMSSSTREVDKLSSKQL